MGLQPAPGCQASKGVPRCSKLNGSTWFHMVPHGSTWFHMVPRLASKVPGDFVFPPTPTNWWLCIFHFSGRVQANPGQGRPQLQFDDVV